MDVAKFGIVIRVNEEGLRTYYENDNLPIEIVLEQLRALVKSFETDYFAKFSPVGSS